MRKLTIKRRKSFVGSFMSVKIYIVDSVNYDFYVCEYPCRELGKLKNNSELVVEIDNNEHKIIANVNLQATDAFAEMCVIPAGDEDVVVSGKNVFAPFRGNPFIFDEQ